MCTSILIPSVRSVQRDVPSLLKRDSTLDAYKGFTFEFVQSPEYETALDLMRKAKQTLQRRPIKFPLLRGGMGAGKTRVACEIARVISEERKGAAIYLNLVDYNFAGANFNESSPPEQVLWSAIVFACTREFSADAVYDDNAVADRVFNDLIKPKHGDEGQRIFFFALMSIRLTCF